MNSTVISERRLDPKIRILHFAACVCAGFAAIGVGLGIHEANPSGGWFIPVLAGLAAATGFAAFWAVSIPAVVGMVRHAALVALFVVAVIVTIIALGASAASIATAVSGRAALSAELSAQVDPFSRALARAYGEAMKIDAVASSASAKAAGYRKQAETEMAGSNGTGRGCGPKCASFLNIASSFDAGHAALNAMMSDAAASRASGEKALADLRIAASTGDQPGFVTASTRINSAVADLNALDPRPVVAATGAVVVSKNGIDLSKDTADFEAVAERVLSERQSVEAPVFLPLSLGEATRRQMFGSAMHGWVMAACIDVLPLVFLVLSFLLSREVWMQERITRDRVSPEEHDETDRRRLASLHGNGHEHEVLPFRHPAAE